MWSSSILFIYLSLLLFTSAHTLTPRLANPLALATLPIHLVLSPRDVGSGGNATTTASGITSITMSTDRQSYFSIIKIGEINFRVAIDTASSDLWVLSSNCRTKTCISVPRYPMAYQSPTFSSINGNNTQFTASYADGTSASGFVARERVQLSNITVENQVFGMMTDSNVTMTDQTSGIMGLGFPRLSSIASSVTNSTPFFVTLAQQGLLDYPLFGLSLTRNATGTLTIGAVDTSVVKNVSSISWNSVAEFSPFGSESNSSSYFQWAIPMSSFSVNGTEIIPMPTYPQPNRNYSLALFDIGAPGIYGPFADVSRLFSLIDGARLVDQAGQWAAPCDTAVTMSFTFGHRNYTLQPSDYIIGPASGNPNLCLLWPRANPSTGDGIDWQIGTAFLRTVYSIYSYGINSKESPMIGLYPLRNATNTTETPDSIASLLSSATIPTTLPNFLLPTPTYTTPPYVFNTSVSAPLGGIVPSGLATSTYIPILGQSVSNVSALPTITPAPTLLTSVVTDSSGAIVTSTFVQSTTPVALGIPPGWSAGTTLHPSFFVVAMPVLIFSWTLLFSYSFV